MDTMHDSSTQGTRTYMIKIAKWFKAVTKASNIKPVFKATRQKNKVTGFKHAGINI